MNPLLVVARSQAFGCIEEVLLRAGNFVKHAEDGSIGVIAFDKVALARAVPARLVPEKPMAAQDGTPQQGGTLNVVIQPEPPGLMVGLIQNGPTQMVAGDIYESLLRYDANLQPTGQLAESWEIS